MRVTGGVVRTVVVLTQLTLETSYAQSVLDVR